MVLYLEWILYFGSVLTIVGYNPELSFQLPGEIPDRLI